MDSTLPKLRPDIIRRRQETPEGVRYILKDPVRDEFFRLGEVEGFIVDRLDGNITATDLTADAERRFDAELPPETLDQFINMLDRNGLLDNEKGKQVRQRHSRRKRLVGGALYFRMHLFDPENLFSRLAGPTRFFFTRSFMVLSGIIIAAAFLITIFNWQGIEEGASHLFTFAALPIVIMVVFIVGSAHEFAHGLTCTHFGGKVRDMGFLFLYLQPALYCNVSDAWLFEEKHKRLMVGLAGPYFELFIGAVATLVWRATAFDSWVNHLCIVVLATAGIKTFINFNPLVKLDGYYLLSDWLEIPNLRKKAFAYLGDVIRRMDGKIKKLPELTRRERRIYLLYATTGLLGSAVFFTYGALVIGNYFFVRKEQVALLLFSGLVGVRYKQYFNRLFGHARKQSRKLKRVSRFVKHRHALLLKAALPVAIILLLFLGHMQLTVTGPVNVLPVRNADVRTGLSGVVTKMLVSEGDYVRRGQVIATLQDQQQRTDLMKVEATIDQKRALLAQMVSGPTRHQLAVARKSVANWRDQLDFAKQKREQIEALYKQKMVSKSAYDSALAVETTTRNSLAEATAKLHVLQDGTAPEVIKAAQAELDGLEAQRDYLQDEVKEAQVRSPAAGVVATPEDQLVELPGRYITKGGLIAKVFDLDVITVQVSVSEKDIGNVHVGQRIGIRVRAYPDRTFDGEVTRIGITMAGVASLPGPSSDIAMSGSKSGSSNSSPTGTSTATILVVTRIPNHKHLLKPGMTGIAKIYCGRRNIAELIGRRLSHLLRIDLWSWW